MASKPVMNENPRSPMARLHYQHILDKALFQILENPLAGETPGSRLRQYGMMVVVLDLVVRSEAITVSRIVTTTGMTRGATEELLLVLVERGLLTATWSRNSVGRGKARIFALAESADAQ